MAHMTPHVDFFSAYIVDTTCGLQIVPYDVAGVTGLPVDLTLEACLPYIEGKPMNEDPESFGDGIEDRTGYFARLSADGYMDCTEWSGPFGTAKEAMAYLQDMYDIDEDGEDLDDAA